VEETGVPGESHRPVASHLQTLSHNVALNTPRHEQAFELTIVHVLNDITPPQTKRILDRRGRMVVGFITTYAINAYHH
jgi:hypothetical protein